METFFKVVICILAGTYYLYLLNKWFKLNQEETMETKELKYINEDLPQDDKEAVSEIIYNALLEKDINFSSYSYEIHVSYSEEK